MRAIGLSAILICATVASVSAQSLADLARKEEERRKQTPTAGKVYTNKDLGAVPPSSAPPPQGSASTASTPSSEPSASGDKSGAASGDSASKDKPAPAKDEKYWRQRMTDAREAADRDRTLADAVQSRINALTTDFVNRDDPSQRAVIARDRERALAELERLKKQIIADQKAITDLEEEARRAGVPPGWLR
jgi:hypothetical protein